MKQVNSKEKLSTWQIFSLISMVLTSEGIITTSYRLTDNGAWLSMLIAMTIGIILSLVYSFIITKSDEKDIFDIFHNIFGKIFGRLFTIIFIVFSFYCAIVATKNMVIQIKHMNFRPTPYFYLILSYIILYLFSLLKGIEVIGRLSSVLRIILISLTILVTILIFSEFEFFNMMPLVAAPMKEILKGGILDFFIIFGDGVLVLGLVVSSKDKNGKKNKIAWTLIYAYLFSGLINVLSIVYPILVLGFPLANILYYPAFTAFSLIDIAMFITRVEIIISIIYMSTLIIKAIVAMYVATIGLQKMFSSKSNKTYIIPTCIIVYFGSLLLFDNVNELLHLREEHGWLKGIVQVCIPIIIAIILLFKKKPKENTPI